MKYNTLFSNRAAMLSVRVAALLFLVVAMNPVFAGVVVVVGANSSLSRISLHDVRNIFLAKRSELPNGVEAVPVNQKEDSDIYSQFNEQVLGKSSEQVSQYWIRLVFSGKGNPPDSYGGDNAVKHFVNATPGGIGYIDSASVDSSVKVLFTAR